MTGLRRSPRWLLGLLLVLGLTVACGPQEATPRHTAPSSGTTPLPPPVSPTATPETGRGPLVPRPNVVVVMMDDMRFDDLRWMPNTRRHVVDRGITFENSFSPNPLCCPARASFLTGQYSHNHGVLHHEPPYGFGSLDDSFGIGAHLQRAGYRTAMVGKYLNGYGEQPAKATGEPSIGYVPRGWTDWMAGLDNGGGVTGGTYDYFDFTQNINGELSFNTGRYSSEVIASQAADLIRSYSDASPQRPFFLWVNPVAPHHGSPVEADDPPPFFGGDDTWKFQTPARPEWVKGKFNRALTRAPGLPRNGSHPEDNRTDKPGYMQVGPDLTDYMKQATNTLSRQRAESLHAWDREFGRLVRALKTKGQYDDTVLVFTSDNGFFLGEHGRLNGKILPYEESLRVPLAIAGPGIGQGQRFHPATTQDLTATVLDLAGGKPMPDADGASLRPVLSGPDRPWRAPVLTEALLPRLPRVVPDFPELTGIGLRTPRWKYVRWAMGGEELYDLVRDPNELNSLQRDPRFREVKRQFRALWSSYQSCRAAACRKPLPESLQATPEELADLHRAAERERDRYYG